MTSSLSCVSCRSQSGARGVIVASEGFLGILVILPDMRGGWRYRFGYLGGMLQVERRKPFTKGTFTCVKEPPVASSLILGSMESGVSNKVAPFGVCSPEDVSSGCRGVAGCSGRMDGSDLDHLYFFSKI